MENWCITVEMDHTQRHYFVIDKPFELAEMVSKCHPGRNVHVSAMARIRRFYKDGKVTSDWPDLTKFYTNTTDLEQHIFREGNEWPHS